MQARKHRDRYEKQALLMARLLGRGDEDAVVNRGFDRNRSLQDLEHDDWGEPRFDSYLVTSLSPLRRNLLEDAPRLLTAR